jgi:hypothetical protein
MWNYDPFFFTDKQLQLLPLVHPRQAARIGTHSAMWANHHEMWVSSHPAVYVH